MSDPYFVLSGLAIRQDVYLENCIKKHLIPFINKYYLDGGYVFWPDLSSSHCVNSVQNYLKTEKINFVLKQDNLANVPKARPIENFWGNFKRMVYEEDWTAKKLCQLESRIRYCLKKIVLSVIEAHLVTVRKILDHIRRHGVYD